MKWKNHLQYINSSLEGSSSREKKKINEEVMMLKLNAVCLQPHSHKLVIPVRQKLISDIYS